MLRRHFFRLVAGLAALAALPMGLFAAPARRIPKAALRNWARFDPMLTYGQAFHPDRVKGLADLRAIKDLKERAWLALPPGTPFEIRAAPVQGGVSMAWLYEPEFAYETKHEVVSLLERPGVSHIQMRRLPMKKKPLWVPDIHPRLPAEWEEAGGFWIVERCVA